MHDVNGFLFMFMFMIFADPYYITICYNTFKKQLPIKKNGIIMAKTENLLLFIYCINF